MPSCTCLCSTSSKREWGFHVVHSILLCKSYFVHVPWGVPSSFLEHLVDLIIISSCVQLFFRILWLLASFVEVSLPLLFCCNLWILNIVWFPPIIDQWKCPFDSTHFMRQVKLVEELSLCWPSKAFSHFGNCCQWGRSFGGFMAFDFVLWFVLKYFPSCLCNSLLGFVYSGNSNTGNGWQYMK